MGRCYSHPAAETLAWIGHQVEDAFSVLALDVVECEDCLGLASEEELDGVTIHGCLTCRNAGHVLRVTRGDGVTWELTARRVDE